MRISNNSSFLSSSTSRNKLMALENKENICSNIRVKSGNKQKSNKTVSTLKTGVEIRNRLKKSQNAKIESENQCQKKSHFAEPSVQLRKAHQKIFDKKALQQTSQKRSMFNADRQNSQTSINKSVASTKSIKSVTFSIDSSCQKAVHRHSSSSILKNRMPTQSRINILEKKSLASSLCSHVKGFDQSVESVVTNETIFKKYERQSEELKRTHQKFTDSIYPPYEQSIFVRNQSMSELFKRLQQQGYSIKWMRISEVFNTENICVWDTEHKSTVHKGFISTQTKDGDYMSAVFNMIRSQNTILEKIFESQKVNKEGLYCVKIHQTQTNTWKYVILDDYIPVVTNSKYGKTVTIKPAFLNVEPGKNQKLQIWPYLLQKAYAKYYSTYDALARGNSHDFIEEVTGCFTQQLPLNAENLQTPEREKHARETKRLIHRLSSNPLTILLLEDQSGVLSSMFGSKISQEFTIESRQKGYQRREITFEEISKKFTQIHYIECHKYLHNKTCYIRQENLSQSHERRPFILRSFQLQEPTDCTISVIQNEERIHKNVKPSEMKGKGKKSKAVSCYKYSFMRMILLMSEGNQNYRWIGGEYGKKKSTKMTLDLEKGEYFIAIMPEWAGKPYDFNLAMGVNTETTIERKSYEEHAKIVELGCMDLAQRFGRLIQIHKNICTYNYIDYRLGLIIENINNEKTQEDIKVLRSVDSLDDYSIHPLNQEFQGTKKLEIRIRPLDSFTVVLRLQGGVDREFLQQFDFGC